MHRQQSNLQTLRCRPTSSTAHKVYWDASANKGVLVQPGGQCVPCDVCEEHPSGFVLCRWKGLEEPLDWLSEFPILEYRLQVESARPRGRAGRPAEKPAAAKLVRRPAAAPGVKSSPEKLAYSAAYHTERRKQLKAGQSPEFARKAAAKAGHAAAAKARPAP